MNLIRGRFHEEVDKLVTKYTASTPFDWRLYHHDITGSIAHAKMLAKQGIISPQETEIINKGLVSIRQEIEQGRFQFKPELEDIHTLSYNRDVQEDKEGFFDSVDTLLSTLEVFSGMVRSLQVKAENTEQAVKRGYILAADLADYLVKRGEAFRTAHDTVARLVSYAMEKGKSFSELSLSEYKGFSPLFAEDVYSITVDSSIAARDVIGGTAPRQVDRALAAAQKIN